MALLDNILSRITGFLGDKSQGQPSATSGAGSIAPVTQPVVPQVQQPAQNVLGLFGNLGLTSGIPTVPGVNDQPNQNTIVPNLQMPDFLKLLLQQKQRQQAPAEEIAQIQNLQQTPQTPFNIPTLDPTFQVEQPKINQGNIVPPSTISAPTSQSEYYEKYSENKQTDTGEPAFKPYGINDLVDAVQGNKTSNPSILGMAKANFLDMIKKTEGNIESVGIDALSLGQQANQGHNNKAAMQQIQNFAAGDDPINILGWEFNLPGEKQYGGTFPGAKNYSLDDFSASTNALINGDGLYNYDTYLSDVQNTNDLYNKGQINQQQKDAMIADSQNMFESQARNIMEKYQDGRVPTFTWYEAFAKYAQENVRRIQDEEAKSKATNIGMQMIASNVKTPEQAARFMEISNAASTAKLESRKVYHARVSKSWYENTEILQATDKDPLFRTNLLGVMQADEKFYINDALDQTKSTQEFYDKNKKNGEGDKFVKSFQDAFQGQYVDRVVDAKQFYYLAYSRLRNTKEAGSDDEIGLNQLVIKASEEADTMMRQKYGLSKDADISQFILKPLNDVLKSHEYVVGETLVDGKVQANSLQRALNDYRYVANSYVDWGNIVENDPVAGTLMYGAEQVGKLDNMIGQPFIREIEKAFSKKGVVKGLTNAVVPWQYGSMIASNMDPELVDTTFGKLGRYGNLTIERPTDSQWATFTNGLYAGTLDNVPAATQIAMDLYTPEALLGAGRTVMRGLESISVANDFNKSAKVIDFLQTPIKGTLNSGILGEVKNPWAYARFQQIAAPVKGFLWENVQNMIIAGGMNNAGMPYTEDQAKLDLGLSAFAALFAGLSKVGKEWGPTNDLLKTATSDENVKQTLTNWGIKYPSVQDIKDVQNVAALGQAVVQRGDADLVFKNAVAMQQMMQAIQWQNQTYAYFLGKDLSQGVRSGKFLDLTPDAVNFAKRQATLANLPEYDPAKFADSYIARTADDQAVINVGKFTNQATEGRAFLENTADGMRVTLQDRIVPELENIGVKKNRAYTAADISEFVETARSKGVNNISIEGQFEKIPGTELYRAKNLSETADGVLVKEATTTVDILRTEKQLGTETKQAIDIAYKNQYDTLKSIHGDNPQALEAIESLQKNEALQNMTMSLEPTLKDIYC